MKRITTALTIIFALLLSTQLFAQDTVSREEAGLDTSLANTESIKYADPQKILITQITTDAQGLSNNSEDWYKTLYYYSITRDGFPDIPFNYVISREGDIFKGHTGGEGSVPELMNDEGAILIGYLSNPSDLSDSAQRSLKALVADLSYRFGIERSLVEVVELEQITTGEEIKLSKLSYKKTGTNFTLEVSEALDGMTFSSTEHQLYKAEVSEVTYASEVKAGEKLKVSLKVKNLNDFAWFSDSDYIYVSVKGGAESSFAVNGVWDSFSKPIHIEGKTIQPGETVTIEFDLQANLLPGEHSESFNISKAGQIPFADSEFEIGFTITKGDFDLIRIKDTETGYLNVRSCASTGCEQLGRVESGKTFILMEQESSWYKIEYEEGLKGWVYGKYAEKL